MRRHPPHAAVITTGFTLVELLVGMALASVLLLVSASLLGRSSELFGSTRAALSSLADCRALLHFIEAEISSRLPGEPVLTKTAPHGPDRLGIIRIGGFDEVTAASRGDVATSFYYVAFTRDSPDTVSPKLFRQHLDAAATQRLLESPAPWTLPEPQPDIDEPLLHNVVRFEAKPLRLNAAGQYEPWPPEAAEPPAAIEIKIDITDDTTAARFRTEASWQALLDETESSRTPPFIRRVQRTIRLDP